MAANYKLLARGNKVVPSRKRMEWHVVFLSGSWMLKRMHAWHWHKMTGLNQWKHIISNIMSHLLKNPSTSNRYITRLNVCTGFCPVTNDSSVKRFWTDV